MPAEFSERIDPWTPDTCLGLSLDDAVPLTGKGVEQEVFWKGGVNVAGCQGQPVRLRIWVRNADLYGFRFA